MPLPTLSAASRGAAEGPLLGVLLAQSEAVGLQLLDAFLQLLLLDRILSALLLRLRLDQLRL